MAYVQLIIAGLGFLTQLIKWLNNVENHKVTAKEKKEKLITFQDALKKANNGNTEDLERMFIMLRSNKLQDK